MSTLDLILKYSAMAAMTVGILSLIITLLLGLISLKTKKYKWTKIFLKIFAISILAIVIVFLTFFVTNVMNNT